MDCPTCRKKNRGDAKFCSDCGAPLTPRCSACGSELPPESRFCDRCGAEQGSGFRGRASAEAPGPRPLAPDPRSYTPKHLAERILQSRSALEGERKQVTVLFADVQGSMELAEQVDPEEWHRIMDGFFAILSEGVHRFEGTINQYTGDGIMALFGAPVALEDHASRACHAALFLTDELRRYAQELKRERGLRFSVRMGLNSGEVVVGKIGDDLRMDYTAQGATVGLAARMEQLADPGRVYMTEHTEALVRGFFELEELGAFTIKGVHRPVQAYALLGIGPLRSRLEISQRRGFSPFLGRDEEMAELERALQAAAEGRRRIVRVVGEAGIGKSRLCYEFARSCRARGIEVHEAAAVSHGRNIPLLPVLQLFRSLFGVGENDADEEARRKIAGTLVLLDDRLKDLLPVVFDFLGVPDRQHPPSGTVENKQQQLVDLAGRLIVSRSLSRPLVILIEDLHWLDEGSEAFLKHLLIRSEESRALFLLNHRPQYDAARFESAAGRPLVLQPFGPETTQALLRGLLGGDASLAPLHGRLHDHAGGNPFFIEEIVRELEQGGKLAGVRGAYRLVEPVEDVVLPATVQAVLAARMDRLPEPEKGILQTAAVIGKTFSERVLSKVMAAVDGVAHAPDVSAAIRRLTDAEFLSLLEPLPIEYAFKHPLTQEVAYQTQLSDRRRRVHGAVAATLTELDADKLDERAALLAHHWEMADRLWEAAQWNRRAADWAGGRDNTGALWHLRKVLDLLEGIPATRDAAALSISTREGILRLGPFVNLAAEEAGRILDEGRKVAGHAGDGASLVHLVSSYGYYRMMTGEMEEAHRYAQEAASLAQACGDEAAQARISLDDAQAAIWTGRLREGLSIAESALSAHRRGDSPLRGFSVGLAGEAFLLALRGLCLSFMGRAREGTRDLESAIVGARHDGAPEGLLVAHLFRAFGANVAGNTDEAMLHARTALEIALRLQHRFFEPLAVAMLGIAQVFAGRWQEGKRTLEDLLAGDLGGMGILIEPFVLTSLALAHLESGDVDRARDGAARALVLAIERGVKTGECIAQIGVARVSLEIDGVAARATVQHALERAAELIEETGAYSFEPRVHIERAALALALGDLPGRQRELERALELAEAMGVRTYAPDLKAEQVF